MWSYDTFPKLELGFDSLLSKIDGVAPLITDPQPPSFNNLSPQKKFDM